MVVAYAPQHEVLRVKRRLGPRPLLTSANILRLPSLKSSLNGQCFYVFDEARECQFFPVMSIKGTSE